jgi:hypothetical protein
LLSVAPARRAVTDSPTDSDAWLVLAQAYLFLSRTTVEANRNAVLTPLKEIRDIQITTALRPDRAAPARPGRRPRDAGPAVCRAAVLRPRLAAPDQATRAGARTGRLPGETGSAYSERRTAGAGRRGDAREVQTSENRYAVRAEPLAGAR